LPGSTAAAVELDPDGRKRCARLSATGTLQLDQSPRRESCARPSGPAEEGSDSFLCDDSVLVVAHDVLKRLCPPDEARGGLSDHQLGQLGGVASALTSDPSRVESGVSWLLPERSHGLAQLAELVSGDFAQRDRGGGERRSVQSLLDRIEKM
jgi:hypothetical protein